MHKFQLLTMAAAFIVFGVAGCGGPSASSGGVPSKLWVATNGDEQHLKLSTVEPNPY